VLVLILFGAHASLPFGDCNIFIQVSWRKTALIVWSDVLSVHFRMTGCLFFCCFCCCCFLSLFLFFSNTGVVNKIHSQLFQVLMVFLFPGKEYFLNIYTKESQWDPPTEAAERNSDKVQSSHLLVKHRDSRRPSNYKGETITRSKEEAIELLKGKV